MERCTCGILHQAKPNVCLKESTFGVLTHKFLFIAIAGTSCTCAWLFCTAAHWDNRRNFQNAVLVVGDPGYCYFLEICSLSHDALPRVGLEDRMYKIHHLLFFLSCACLCLVTLSVHLARSFTGNEAGQAEFLSHKPPIFISVLSAFLLWPFPSLSIPRPYLPLPILFAQDFLPATVSKPFVSGLYRAI